MSIFSLFAAPQVMAQSGDSQIYDPTFMGKVPPAVQSANNQKEQQQAQQGFQSPTSITVALVNHDYMDPNQFGIQMTVPDMVSGCFEISPLEYEAEFIDPYFLDIKVKKYRMVMPEGRADLQKCSVQNKMATALMVLDKNDLKSRGTKEIRFSADAGRDVYDIVLTDSEFQLIPQTTNVFKPKSLTGDLKDRMAYSFNGDGTIVLQVPMAKPDDNIAQEIEIFATSRALTPMKNGINVMNNGLKTFAYRDDNGRFGVLLNDDGYAEIGTITVMRPHDGPDGRTQAPVELTVFATRPGTEL